MYVLRDSPSFDRNSATRGRMFSSHVIENITPVIESLTFMTGRLLLVTGRLPMHFSLVTSPCCERKFDLVTVNLPLVSAGPSLVTGNHPLVAEGIPFVI
jgi:hypothetical protein